MAYTLNISEGALEPFSWEIIDFNWTTSLVESYKRTMVWISLAYVLLAFIGQEIMKNRKPFDLRQPLIIWNLALTIFSTVGFIRTFPGLLYLLRQPEGFYRSVCVDRFAGDVDHFWAFAYTLTKPLEFIDTAFIVLRKSPLIFLHYYHHMTMVIFTFYSFSIGDPVSRYSGITNSAVHSIMYFYYSLKVARFQIPPKWSSKITTLQLIQFVLTISANLYAYFIILVLKLPCSLSKTTVVFQVVGTASYLALFVNYYYQTYVKKRPKKA